MAVRGGDGGWCGAKTVVENFERKRALVAGFHDLGGEACQIEIALAREAAVVAAPFEHVHGELRRIGNLHEGDAIARNIGDRVHRIVQRQRMKAVEHEPQIRMIDRIDEFPRMAVGLDVLAPRERLIAGDHAGRFGRAGQCAELVDHQRIVADGVGRDVAAHQNPVRAQFVHHVELALRAIEIAFEAFRAYAVEIAERLKQHDLQPEILGDAPHVGG